MFNLPVDKTGRLCYRLGYLYERTAYDVKEGIITLYDQGAFLYEDQLVFDEKSVKDPGFLSDKEKAGKETMAFRILKDHNLSGNDEKLNIRFDALTSHDITYVGIIQTARASGLKQFPMPYVLTNCHNSLCAVGGTINEDDHMFGLSAAKKYGGIYVPPHLAVIHQYARERLTGGGRMVLGSDSHTRYGALGTMGFGEGGPELVKQLLKQTYDINRPQVVAVYLKGKPKKGVGPQDVAIALVGATFGNGFVKNKVLEFVGPGVDELSVDFRIGVDVMTTETTCLSSIWKTDGKVADFFDIHGRKEAYKELKPGKTAYYDSVIVIDLDELEPMIAMPFHPSNAYTIRELNENLEDILADTEKKARVSFGDNVNFTLRDKVKDGALYVEQGVIGGCAGGGFENLCDAADMLDGQSIGNGDFSLSVYPASQPVLMELLKNGSIQKLLSSGATVRTAFCGPCFGAGDVPANNGLSVRHSTRNFPNREGSRIQDGQIASVALMDARSIAATAMNGGRLTSALDVDAEFTHPKYFFDASVYDKRVYDGWGKPEPETEIRRGPNIVDWPEQKALKEDLIIRIVSEIHDPVTTTDELIPSGETSSYRSNPPGLAEFTLSRKDPAYVGRAKEVRHLEELRVEAENGSDMCPGKADMTFAKAVAVIKGQFPETNHDHFLIGSVVFAEKPGDGSAREQAASCQRVLGGVANIAREYATKRYRSNLINWGMIPFLIDGELPFKNLDYIYIPGIRKAIQDGRGEVTAYKADTEAKALVPFTLRWDPLTEEEKKIILSGCLINFNKEKLLAAE